MRFNALNRKVHYWATLFIALPVVVIVGSGLLLQVKKRWSWIQPAEKRGAGTSPVIDLEGLLAAAQKVEALNVNGWEDVNRIDVRPSRGMAKVWLNSGWEVQVDLGTGSVLQVAYRRSDLIESIHDGSFFGGEVVKTGLFLPTGIALLLMWLTGLWMFVRPFIVRRRRTILASEIGRRRTS